MDYKANILASAYMGDPLKHHISDIQCKENPGMEFLAPSRPSFYIYLDQLLQTT